MQSYRSNHKIVEKQVMLILEGKSQGVVDREYALSLAAEQNKDLVQVGQGDVPICKIMDYGRFCYEQKKQQKKQKPVVVKEIRMRISTDEHDFELKEKQIGKFISKGYHVKISIQLKGREKNYKSVAIERLQKICNHFENETEYSKVDSVGTTVMTMLIPKKGK